MSAGLGDERAPPLDDDAEVWQAEFAAGLGAWRRGYGVRRGEWHVAEVDVGGAVGSNDRRQGSPKSSRIRS